MKTTAKKQNPKSEEELAKKLNIKQPIKIFERSGLKIDIDETGDVMFNLYGSDKLIIGFLLLTSEKNKDLYTLLQKITYHFAVSQIDELAKKHGYVEKPFGHLKKNKREQNGTNLDCSQ